MTVFYKKMTIKKNNFIIGKINIYSKNKIVGYLNFVKNKSILTITYLFVEPNYRNKGYASFLLKKIISYAKQYKIKQIELDNMSDSNIYLNHGFIFISNYGPEMILSSNKFE